MTATEIIAARIRKYTADLSSSYDDCECPSCVGTRHTLKELEYLQMAVRNLDPLRAAHTTSQRAEK